ncbi:MAG: DsbA family protein, partial [Bosea sp. (in: a-proteobacteria)]|nr:DsbA family protein [Bosea sp. (in: a-proteobacteria)]
MALSTLPRRLARLMPALALGLGLAAASAPVLAQGTTPSKGLTAEQRKAVVGLIRETLLQNPELIQEALIELERRNAVAQADAQRSAVTA